MFEKEYKKIQEIKERQNEIKKEMAPLNKQIQELEDKKSEKYEELVDYRKEHNLNFFRNNDPTFQDLKQEWMEIGKKIDDLYAERKPYEEKIEKLGQTIEEVKKQIENSQNNKKSIKFHEMVEESGLNIEEWRRQQLIEVYGTTTNPAFAGYILPGGEMIDMGDGRKRTEDHRLVIRYFDPATKEGQNQEDALYAFISEGNIRFIPEGPGITINVNYPLTQEQKMAMYDIIDYAKENGNCFYVDMVDDNANIVKSFIYENRKMNVQAIAADINFEVCHYKPDRGLEQVHER